MDLDTDLDLIQSIHGDRFHWVEEGKAFKVSLAPLSRDEDCGGQFVTFDLSCELPPSRDTTVKPSLEITSPKGISDMDIAELKSLAMTTLENEQSLFAVTCSLEAKAAELNERVDGDCPICLSNLEDEDTSPPVSRLSTCLHSFHTACLSEWWFGTEGDVDHWRHRLERDMNIVDSKSRKKPLHPRELLEAVRDMRAHEATVEVEGDEVVGLNDDDSDQRVLECPVCRVMPSPKEIRAIAPLWMASQFPLAFRHLLFMAGEKENEEARSAEEVHESEGKEEEEEEKYCGMAIQRTLCIETRNNTQLLKNEEFQRECFRVSQADKLDTIGIDRHLHFFLVFSSGEAALAGLLRLNRHRTDADFTVRILSSVLERHPNGRRWLWRKRNKS